MRDGLGIAEDRIVALGPARGVGEEIEVPRPHACGIEREGEGLASGLDLAGPLGHPPFQRLVGDPQALLGLLAHADVLARLILAPPNPDRRGDGADQSLGVDRPFQQHDVAEALDHRRAPRRAAPGLARRKQDERKIRPGRLRVEPRVESLRIHFEQRLFRDDGGAGHRLQGVQPRGGIGTEGEGRPGFGQELADDGAVATARSQDQDPAFLVADPHLGRPASAVSPRSIATSPR